MFENSVPSNPYRSNEVLIRSEVVFETRHLEQTMSEDVPQMCFERPLPIERSPDMFKSGVGQTPVD